MHHVAMNTGTLAIASATELHRIFSSGVEHLNHQGQLPLHLACTSNGVQSADMVVFLLRLFPGKSEQGWPWMLAACICFDSCRANIWRCYLTRAGLC